MGCRAIILRRCLPYLLLLTGVALASAWVPQPQGRFVFRAVVEGEPFVAEFRRFEVTPAIDPAAMPTGFDVEIDLAAIDSGNRDRDREMASREWFDLAEHPAARFRSTAVTPLGDGAYVVAGDLAIKGAVRRIEIPFDWRSDGSSAAMRGRVDLDRRWFGVGPDDDSSVGATVSVSFDLQWERQ
jgi:polyisoprenoid-binding protein YceI